MKKHDSEKRKYSTPRIALRFLPFTFGVAPIRMLALSAALVALLVVSALIL